MPLHIAPPPAPQARHGNIDSNPEEFSNQLFCHSASRKVRSPCPRHQKGFEFWPRARDFSGDEKLVRDLSHSFLVLLLIALYTTVVIKTFRDKDTDRLFNREAVKRFREIERSARRKLEMVDAAEVLDNLRFPPSNRLEALKGNRKGHHSVRINAQYRVCFVWGDDNNAYDVEVCDYH